MSEVMVQVLEAKYKEMEFENNLKVMEATNALSEVMEATKPDSLKRTTTDKAPVVPVASKEENKEVSSESEAHFAPFSAGNEHAEFAKQMEARQAGAVSEVVKEVEKQVILDEVPVTITSPKKKA
jgi:hypothetical protein